MNRKSTYKKSIVDRMKAKDTSNLVRRHLWDEPTWKKTLKGRLMHVMKYNLLLCENKFSPLSFTESIAPRTETQNTVKFKPLDDRIKVNIFTNVNPQVLQPGLHFYSRYFDYFQSPDELLAKHFTEKEIIAIKSDPFYFKFTGSDYGGVGFFKKKSLTDVLNEEEKVGIKKVIKMELKDSLKKTKKKIDKYLDYYTYVMSQKDFIQDRRSVAKRTKKNKFTAEETENN